jgi:tetratricopeptide (TPR) repeat protein
MTAHPIVVRASFRQLWQIPAFLTGLLALIAVWAGRPLWYDPDSWQFRRDMVGARRMLEDAHASANGALARAADALTRVDRFPGRAGEAHFLLGSAYLRLADQVPADRALDTRQKARFHLEQAHTLGVPETDRLRLMYRLGKVWYQTNGEMGQAANYLVQSIAEGADDRYEAFGILAQVFLRLNNIPGALQANEKQLQVAPIEDEDLLAGPRLLRGELLLRLPGTEAREAARKVLSRIGPGASPPIVARARLLLARILQEDGVWDQAASFWEAILADKREAPAEPGRISYWLGYCYHQLQRPTDAVRAWEQAVKYGGEEAQAATLRLAEARLRAGSEAAAVKLFEQALANVGKPADYRNGLLGLGQAQALVQASCQASTNKGSFESAQALARLYAQLAETSPAQALRGDVMLAWARASLKRAQQEKKPDVAAREYEASRQRFTEAGAAYEAVAEATIDNNEKSNQLWRAADAYVQAQNFDHTVGALEQFVKLQPAVEPRLGEAWYRLGEAHQALAHDSTAVLSFNRCIQHPGPFAYRARYQLAVLKRSDREADGMREAIEILQQNLQLMREDPDREAHEKTLYELADLLYRSGNYRSAVERWEQALMIYPGNPYALEARFRLGECYRSLASEEMQIQPLAAPFAIEVRPHFHRTEKQWLEKAAASYQKVIDDLEVKRAAGTLTDAEAVLLRNSYFFLADTRYALGDYTAACDMYQALASRYQQQYEGLVALKQLWLCALNPPEKGYIERLRSALERTRDMLNKLPDAVFRGQPQTREAWEQWLRDREADLKKLQPLNSSG